MKKFLSSALAMLMTLSCIAPPAAFAADKSTIVEYTADTQEEFLLTVPASLEAGTSGNVTLKGKWASNKTYSVTAEKSVTMTCDLGGTKTLTVTFPGIELAGSNTVEVSETKQVSVAEMTGALFGNWSGTFKYNLNSTGGSSSSGPDDDEDWSDAVEFTVDQSNRAAVGYTGTEDENLVIPAYFVGDGENGTTEGTKYKVTSIKQYTFNSCEKLVSVTIPNSVTNLGQSVFSNCKNLTSIIVNDENKSYKSIDGVLFTQNKTELVQYPGGKTGAYIIPPGVTTIGQEAFVRHDRLTDITIPEGVTNIGVSAFANCSGLTNITLPSSAINIGENAFGNCQNLVNVTILEGITNIANYTFDGCINLTSVTIPKSVTNIGINAFANCTSLTSIIIPDSVIGIGDSALDACVNLTDITFEGTQEQWAIITKGKYWDYNTGSYTIHCTDGDIAKS